MSGERPAALLDAFRVVLVRPKDPLNLGMVARAMTNMGLRRLVLVCPEYEIDSRCFIAAVGCTEVIERSTTAASLPDAVADCSYVIGFTRRAGKIRRVRRNFRSRIEQWAAAAQSNRIALVFGPEDAGLSTEELAHCTERICLPTSSEFPSINLAQAVLIAAYEVYTVVAEGEERESGRKLAAREELEGLYGHMERSLAAMRYFGARHTAFAMQCFRDIFQRAGMNSQEVRMWRGVFSRVDRLMGKSGLRREEEEE